VRVWDPGRNKGPGTPTRKGRRGGSNVGLWTDKAGLEVVPYVLQKRYEEEVDKECDFSIDEARRKRGFFISKRTKKGIFMTEMIVQYK
jgi:hypothetical protein